MKSTVKLLLDIEKSFKSRKSRKKGDKKKSGSDTSTAKSPTAASAPRELKPKTTSRERELIRRNLYEGRPIHYFPRTGLWHTDTEWKPDQLQRAREFAKLYSEMGVEGIKAEFNAEVKDYKCPTSQHVASDANRAKNRDDKDLITCLDESRVELSDKKYINASWMYDLQHNDRKYIVAQAPLYTSEMNTMEEFWQMVYEMKALCVLLITSTEMGKKLLHKGGGIWPPTEESKVEVYGKMSVKCFEEDTWILWEEGPKIELTREGCKDTHTVHVFQHPVGMPGNGYIFDKTLDAVARLEGFYSRTAPKQKLSIVVIDDMCGISGASSLVVIDVIGSLLYKGKNVSLPSIVKWARRCRGGAIASEGDYINVVRAILSYFTDFTWNETKDKKDEDEEFFKKAFEKVGGQF